MIWTRILLFTGLVTAAVHAESVRKESRLEIGPNGVSFSSGGPPLGVRVEEGTATFNFSVSNLINPRERPTPRIPPAPPASYFSSPSRPSAFTDSNTFFDSIGK